MAGNDERCEDSREGSVLYQDRFRGTANTANKIVYHAHSRERGIEPYHIANMFSAGTRDAHAKRSEDPVCKQRCGGQARPEALPQTDKSLHAQSGRLKCFCSSS